MPADNQKEKEVTVRGWWFSCFLIWHCDLKYKIEQPFALNDY